MGLRFEVLIKDVQGLEHKSAERYLWSAITPQSNDSLFFVEIARSSMIVIEL